MHGELVRIGGYARPSWRRSAVLTAHNRSRYFSSGDQRLSRTAWAVPERNPTDAIAVTRKPKTNSGPPLVDTHLSKSAQKSPKYHSMQKIRKSKKAAP